jgi:hypothetical protein
MISLSRFTKTPNHSTIPERLIFRYPATGSGFPVKESPYKPEGEKR